MDPLGQRCGHVATGDFVSLHPLLHAGMDQLSLAFAFGFFCSHTLNVGSQSLQVLLFSCQF
jgi:hypothetical protein